MTIRASTMDGASSLAMAMASVKSMCIRWKGSGRSDAVGCVHIGAYLKRNSRCMWGSSNLCTTSASEAKRYCLRSLSCSSRKTPESNQSDAKNSVMHFHGGKFRLGVCSSSDVTPRRMRHFVSACVPRQRPGGSKGCNAGQVV
jgi:hypothetical protein